MTNESNLNTEVRNTKGRLMYKTSDESYQDDYGMSSREVRTPVAGIGASVANSRLLVSSKDNRGLHRPALDIDVPMAWVKRSDGSDCIYVDVVCSKRRYEYLFQVLREFRLVDAAYTTPLTREDTRRCYEADRQSCVDPGPITDCVVEMAPSWSESYDQLLRYSYDMIEGDADMPRPPESKRVIGPDMKHPILLPLHVDVVALKSTTNHHLYLNTILSLDGYKRVLNALQRARIVERQWSQSADTFGATFLRPPWVNKHGGPSSAIGKKADVEDILKAKRAFSS